LIVLCVTNLIRLNVCKHIHACIRKIPLTTYHHIAATSTTTTNNNNNQENTKREETILTQSVVKLLPVGSSVSARTELDCLLMKVNHLAELIEPENEKEGSKGVKRLITHFESIIKKQDPSVTQPKKNPIEPANKKIATQRFKSTKKKRAVKQERKFVKPGDVQRELLTCMFENKEVREAEVVQVQSIGDFDHTY